MYIIINCITNINLFCNHLNNFKNRCGLFKLLIWLLIIIIFIYNGLQITVVNELNKIILISLKNNAQYYIKSC